VKGELSGGVPESKENPAYSFIVHNHTAGARFLVGMMTTRSIAMMFNPIELE
jgi:hypothetical protein